MRLSVNCSGIADHRFPTQGLEDIKKSGFEFISVFTDASYAGKIKRATEKKERTECCDQFEITVNGVLSKARADGLNPVMIRSPYLSGYTDDSFNELQYDLALRTIMVCENEGCKYAVIPPLSFGNQYRTSKNNREYYTTIAASVKESGTVILIENRCDQYNGHFIRSDFSDAHKLSDFIDELNETVGTELFGVCLNSGDSNLCGTDMNEFITTLGSRIKAVIIRDNDGINDISLMPFSSVNKGSKADWSGMICGLRNIGFEGELILDISDSVRAVFPDLNVKLLEFADSVGELFIRQISLENELKKYKTIVLFGAGNMCSKYMNSLGRNYRPVYICDNNKKKWGGKIFGLEIKEPAELLKLSKESAILICNIYYREIEAQIREMGIDNPVLIYD